MITFLSGDAVLHKPGPSPQTQKMPGVPSTPSCPRTNVGDAGFVRCRLRPSSLLAMPSSPSIRTGEQRVAAGDVAGPARLDQVQAMIDVETD
jgi:hypothetical protein